MIITGKSLTPGLREQIALLLETPVGTVALDRDFGIDQRIVDEPIGTIETQAAAEIAEKMEKYIPQIRLERVKVSAPKAEIGIAELEVIVKNAD